VTDSCVETGPPNTFILAAFYQAAREANVFLAYCARTRPHIFARYIPGSPGAQVLASELKDWAQILTACDFLGSKNIQLTWGPGRHGPGHNIYTYHRNPDDQIIELFTELDEMLDEDLGYFDPRPWHRDRPQKPKVWSGPSDVWGPPSTPEHTRQRN